MARSYNPYIGRKPRVKTSVVAYVDILGSRKLMENACKKGRVDNTLTKLHHALEESYQHIDPRYANVFHGTRKPDFSYFKTFTDNIVLGYPAMFFGENELLQAIGELSRFQMRLALSGFFIRGGISIGDLYMDNITVYGPALIEAIEAEHNIARNPRIILTTSAKKVVDEELEYYPLKDDETPYVQDLCKDADGLHYIDYLKAIVPSEGYFRKSDLKNHRIQIERKLKKYKGDPGVLSKYMWVAQYHNEFCGSHANSNNQKIDLDSFRSPVCRSIITPM